MLYGKPIYFVTDIWRLITPLSDDIFSWNLVVLSQILENKQSWGDNGSVKEPNKFHNYETEKITRQASDVAEYIELFGSSTRDLHAQLI